MLGKLKKKVRELLYKIWDIRQFAKWKRLEGFDLIYVFDIDNTLTISNLGAPLDHHNPNPRKGLLDFVANHIASGVKVVFLSARDYRLYKQTELWLSKQGVYNAASQELYLVKSSISKIAYLKRISVVNKKVIFVDDLSYNYENDEIKFYTKTKNALKELELDYLGLEFINKYI